MTIATSHVVNQTPANAANTATTTDNAVEFPNRSEENTNLLRKSPAGSGAWEPTDPNVYYFAPDADVPLFHPSTTDFPIIDSYVDQLAESIGADGQAEPVLVLVVDGEQEKLVDGRHRILACRKMGCPCAYRKTCTLPDSLCASEFVWRKFRQSSLVRQMTRVELAFAGARVAERLSYDAKSRQRRGVELPEGQKGSSYAKAAELLGGDLRENAVRDAHDILEKCSQLEDFVRNRKLPLSTAAKIANLADHGRRGKAIDAIISGKDKRALRAILNDSDNEETLADRLGWDEQAKRLFVQWDQHIEHLRSFGEWVSALVKSDERTDGKGAGRVLLRQVRCTTASKLVTVLTGAKPFAQCHLCPADQLCLACSGTGWLTEEEVRFHTHAASEAYKAKLIQAKS